MSTEPRPRAVPEHEQETGPFTSEEIAALRNQAERDPDVAYTGIPLGRLLDEIERLGDALTACESTECPDCIEQLQADAVTVTLARADARYLVDTWTGLTGTRGRIVDAYRAALGTEAPK